MRLRSKGRHSLSVGALRPKQHCPPLTRGASQKAIALRKYSGHPKKHYKGLLRKGKTKPKIFLRVGKKGISGRRDKPVSSLTQAPNNSIEKARGRMSRKSLEKRREIHPLR